MSICIPYTVIEPIVGSLSAQVWQSSAREIVQDSKTRRSVEALLRQAPLEMAIELGSLDLTVEDVLDIEEGDTLILDAPVDRPLSIVIDGFGRFRCRPGVRGKRIAVRLTEVLAPPQGIPEEGESAEPQQPLQIPPALEGEEPAPALQTAADALAIAPPDADVTLVPTELKEVSGA